ncbi:MAG: TraB/GumN family protein [Hyphomonas sp.]|nr:TraB/GumN family protein [Hyphomonas sp.]MCB9972609.1 TraB/GumN family protein [Hyphomonas sp.]
MKSWVWPLIAATMLGLAACTPKSGTASTHEPPETSREALKAVRDKLYEDALAKAEASHGDGEPALWKMADDDTTIYFIGTVHLLRPDLDWRSPEIDAAVNAADTLVFETDISSDAAQADMMRFVSKNGMFTDGRQLTSLMDDVEKAELQDALDYLGLPLGAVQPMRPWFAAINLSVVQIQKDGFDPNSGVEQILEKEGTADGKSFAYLETIDEQLGRFANLPDAEQVEFLVSTAESVEEGSEMLDVLVDEWADGDVNGIGVLMSNPDMMGSEAVYDALLKARNDDWVPKIEAMLDKPGTMLVAVGAGHLAGKDSVIEQLRARGHDVSGP